MALYDLLGSVRRWPSWWRARRRWSAGATDVDDARRLADAERAAGESPAGCAWLDDRTVEDLELPLVFRAIDRTVTPLGAQALWRWLVAPAVAREVLARREQTFAPLAAQPALREQIRGALAGPAAVDAAYLPRLLWEPPPDAVSTRRYAALLVAVIGLAALAVLWWPPLAIGAAALFIANVVIDDWASLRLAQHGRALQLLARTLVTAARVLDGVVADAAIARDLAMVEPLRRRIGWLTVRDPFDLAEVVRAGLLVRILLVGRFLREIDRERARLRRIVLWLGELDAAVSIASLRAERPDARLPELTGTRSLNAERLAHPAVTGAVGNDLALAAGLLITGSNMSGKSTFLRTIAINAICAQSIHTTFGRWRAPLVRVFAVMRIADATEAGMSTYAVEVAAIGALVAAVDRRDHGLPALLVVDEPFRGTNPALRVPIVVATLHYLGARDIAIAATHDLDVAAQLDAQFARGYFGEPDDDTGRFDYTLRPGIAPTSNALALLVRAGYPRAIIAAVERSVGAPAAVARVR